MATKKTAIKKQPSEKKRTEMTSLDIKKYELHKKGKDVSFQSGGRATHGYGKAYMKGGRVK